MPYNLHLLKSGTEGNKSVYFRSLCKDLTTIANLQAKRSQTLMDEVSVKTITKAFKNAKSYSPSVYQQYNQFKLLHRRTVNNKVLCRIGISPTKNVYFVKTNEVPDGEICFCQ